MAGGDGVMAAMQSRLVRTLLWGVEANWGNTGSSPLLSVVTLGSVTVAMVGEDGEAMMGRVSTSSRTLTRLLMVLRILLTVTDGAWDRASFIVISLEA